MDRIHYTDSTQLRKDFPSEYRSWKCMKGRCYVKSNGSYKYCGARGVIVCERWRNSFAAFLTDMGPKPTRQHTIDRFPDRYGNYEPSNCRWATKTEQQINTNKARFLEHAGKKLCLAEWARETGIPVATISSRIDDFGFSVADALTVPSCPGGHMDRKYRTRVR